MAGTIEEYKFYMQRYVNGAWEASVDIEAYFNGLKYLSCKGLSSFGKIKNIYTETYAETDELRTYIPDNVARENTDIVLKLIFIGKTRRDLYHEFVEWLSGHKIRFWDTLRGREVEMILIDSVEPEEDYLKDGEKYIIASFKFKNLKGKTEMHI